MRMTHRAHEIVSRVTSHPRLGRRSGLRIAEKDSSDDNDALDVRTVAGPEPGDRVVEDEGARVYLDEVAEPRVDGQVLDAVTEDTGRVQFRVKD